MAGFERVANILVVEDDKETVEITSRALGKGGWRATIALSMEDALMDFDRIKFDLVVTDIVMAGMGGDRMHSADARNSSRCENFGDVGGLFGNVAGRRAEGGGKDRCRCDPAETFRAG